MQTLEQQQAFFDKCSRHDWYFQWSDDGQIWRRGLTADDALKAEAATDPALAEIRQAWFDFYFSGDAFGTPRAPRPVRPS